MNGVQHLLPVAPRTEELWNKWKQKPMSREELARDVELLKGKVQTLKQARVRIERKAMQLADAIKTNQRVYA